MEDNKIKFSLGQKVIPSEGYERGWKRIKPYDIDQTKPMIFCFGGNGNISDVFANGMTKVALGLLGTKIEDSYINLYGVSYSFYDSEFTMTGFLDEEDIDILSKTLFLDRLISKNEKMPVEQACKQMRKITLLTHCYGAFIAEILLRKTAMDMKEQFGYTDEETRKILKNIFQIGYAPFIKGESLSSNFYLCTFNDNVLNTKPEEFSCKSGQFMGAGKLCEKNGNLYLVSNSFLCDDEIENVDEHMIKIIKRNSEWYPDLEVYKDGKKVDTHRLDSISKCTALALAMSVTNSKENEKSETLVPLPTTSELKALLKPIIDKENKSIKTQRERKDFREKNPECIKKVSEPNEISV